MPAGNLSMRCANASNARQKLHALGLSALAAMIALSVSACRGNSGGELQSELSAGDLQEQGVPLAAAPVAQADLPHAPSQAELEAKLMSELARLGVDPAKVMAKAPSGPENAVFDLTAESVAEENQQTIRVQWTEVLRGDYDRNGIVGITDLTPIGAQFRKQVQYLEPADAGGIEHWPLGDPLLDQAGNWHRARIDGDSNGEINLADITTMAVHWGERLVGYRVYRRGPGDAEFQLLPIQGQPVVARSVQAPSAAGGVVYSIVDIPELPGAYEYRVAPYDSVNDEEGALSNTASMETSSAPHASFVADKVAGEPPLVVQFDATASSSAHPGGITEYSWDFDGDGEFDVSSGEPQAEHTFTVSGSFNVLLRATDGSGLYGEASQVVLVNTAPQARLDAQPYAGASPLVVTFDAAGSNDDEGAIVGYEWDFDGDGVYDQSTTTKVTEHTYLAAGNWSAVLRVTDGLGGTDTDSYTVEVDPAPNPALWCYPGEGPAPLLVMFTADGSREMYSEIVSYEWDFNGDGVFEYNSGTDAVIQHLYETPGDFTAAVRVTNSGGSTASEVVPISVGSVQTELRWQEITLPSGGSTEWLIGAAMVEGKPAVMYLGRTGPARFAAKFMRASDSEGIYWGDGMVVDPECGNGFSPAEAFAIINGRPAAASLGAIEDNGPHRLRFHMANDPAGESWREPVQLLELDQDLNYLSLAEVSGMPAIAFSKSSAAGGGLSYIRALDGNGSSWGNDIFIPMHSSAWEIDLEVIGGVPCIAYDCGSLYYARALDATGGQWADPVMARLDGGDFASLETINGVPAIAHMATNSINNDVNALYYTHALDSQGEEWELNNILDEEGESSWSANMRIVGGLPTIAYTQSKPLALKLVEASDANASGWEEPEVVASHPYIPVNHGVELLDNGGRPAIVTYSGGILLYYIRDEE